MTDPSPKPDRFKPSMPTIPGVPAPADKTPAESKIAKSSGTSLWTDRNLQIRAAAALVLLLCLVLVLFRVLKKEPFPAAIVANNAAAASGASPSQAPPPASELPVAPGPVSSIQDMARPWSVVKFQMKLLTGERAPAMVIRLPGGSAASAYWGLLSVAPFGQCELELVTDLAKIAQDYGYRARHPMLVDSCTQTVYDPLSYGSAHSRLVRGQVVKGMGLRPPMAVEILIQKGSVVATRSE